MEDFMKLKNMTREELEVLSYTDLTDLLLKENKKPMNTAALFKKICALLGYTEEEYAAKIGDYYTSLTTDKRFVLLDSGDWDLRDHHSVEIVIDDDEELFEEEEEEPEEEMASEEEEDIDVALVDDDLTDDDDDIDDLAIISDEEEEEE